MSRRLAIAGLLLATGCGFVDLWIRTEPIDPVQRGCERGISAFCTCREISTGQPCSDESFQAWVDRCTDREPAVVEFVQCLRDTRDSGTVPCEEVSYCGAFPGPRASDGVTP